MSFKDDVMFYLSKGKIYNGFNLYENDDVEDQEDFDKEDEKEDEDEEKDTKKKSKKCPDCGEDEEDCKCSTDTEDDDDEDEDDDEEKDEDEEEKSSVKTDILKNAKTRGKGAPSDFGDTDEEKELIRRVIKTKAKARGKGPAPDFGATPEEGVMALDAEIASRKKKKNSSVDNGIVSDDDGDRVKKDAHCGVSTKTVADDEDDQYHPHSSVKTKKDDLGVGVNGSCDTEKPSLREEILAYLK